MTCLDFYFFMLHQVGQLQQVETSVENLFRVRNKYTQLSSQSHTMMVETLIRNFFFTYPQRLHDKGIHLFNLYI